jgi:hypothetical protein
MSKEDKDIKRFIVCETLGGGQFGYGVEDRLSHSPWPKRFNITELEAEKYAEELNSRKGWDLSWWDKFLGKEQDKKRVFENERAD